MQSHRMLSLDLGKERDLPQPSSNGIDVDDLHPRGAGVRVLRSGLESI